MTLRRYAPMKQGRGTVIPSSVRRAVHDRDRACVGPRIGMPGECFGQLEIDHVRASGAIGRKSESSLSNAALLCSTHHRVKTENGRTWRPLLLAYIDNPEAA